MQVDSTPSSSTSYNPWIPHMAAAPTTVVHAPSSSPFQSSKRPRPTSPSPFDQPAYEPSPKRPHLPTPQQSNEQQQLLFSAQQLHLSSQQLPPQFVDSSMDGMAVDGDATMSMSMGMGGGMDGLSSLEASNRGDEEWIRQAQLAISTSPFPPSSSGSSSTTSLSHHSAFYPITTFPSQTPLSTPHHSPSRSHVPLPLPPACQQQLSSSSHMGLPAHRNPSLFRSPSQQQHPHPHSSLSLDEHENPLSHSVQSYSTSGVGRPLQPPAPSNGKSGYTMGPRADCEKCRLGVPGHWGHYGDGGSGNGRGMVMN
ncbi:hypothetical protein BDY24DRAFT_417782 [Mrakia frigida]|uniref:uncharacterized protein n=1 Tax=Mrakia frigida TaxID=29902 RepID=UPI003FCBF522